MRWRRTWGQALSRAAARPQTMFALTGMIIGAAGLVALLSVQGGISAAATAQLAGLSSRLVTVYPARTSASGLQTDIGSSTLTTQDLTILSDPGRVPDSVGAAPLAAVHQIVTADSRTWATDIVGSSEIFGAIRGYSVTDGRPIQASDIRISAPVVLIGQTVAQNLFAGQPVLGRILRINTHPFQVIGVLAPKGTLGTVNQDDIVVAPITAVWAYVLPQGAPRVNVIMMEASSPAAVGSLVSEATQALMLTHHITDPANVDFTVRSSTDTLTALNNLGNLMGLLLGAIAAIGLAMGGVGAAVVAFALVGQRVREIGIRRAIGATEGNIFHQFLAESIIVTSVAGLIGVMLGAVGTAALARVIPGLPAPSLHWQYLVMAFAAVLVAGGIAGTFPALRAARTMPALALRPN